MKITFSLLKSSINHLFCNGSISPMFRYFFGMLFVECYSALHGAIQPYVLKVLLDKASAHMSQLTFIRSCFTPAINMSIMGALAALRNGHDAVVERLSGFPGVLILAHRSGLKM